MIALVGDGGLLFTVGELAAAAELGLPLPVVVANNQGYGEIRNQMADEGIGRWASTCACRTSFGSARRSGRASAPTTRRTSRGSSPKLSSGPARRSSRSRPFKPLLACSSRVAPPLVRLLLL